MLGARLEIQLDPGTDAVVINTRDIDIQLAGELVVTGDPSRVILNLAGKGRHAAVGQASNVVPAVLGPGSTIRIKPAARLHRDVLAMRVIIEGGSVEP
jgi:hypothetical protein